MKNLNTAVFAVVAFISLLTLGVGTYAWMTLEGHPRSFGEAFYTALLAIGGSEDYRNQTDFWLLVTRWLGAASGLALVLGAAALFAGGYIRRFWVSRLTGHLVLVGVNDFSLSYMLARRSSLRTLVLIDTEAALAKHAAGRFGGRVSRAPVDFIDEAAVAEAIGRSPREVVFADPSASLNIERAQAVMAIRGKLPLRIRSEKQNITADLDLWSPEFTDVPVLSETELTARALVTELEPMNLARLRAQDRPHVAIVGIGDMALGIIEELALRCHAPDMEPLIISTFDKDADAAWRKLEMERGGLVKALKIRKTRQLNGIECGRIDLERDPLCQAHRCGGETAPLTAIIVCTGDDEVNVDIALRLRRLQDERGLCMAPIMMRSRTAASIGPDPIKDVSGGLFRFGGPQVRGADIAYEAMQLRVGRAMHDIWGKEEPEKATPWDALDLGMRRANTRAALSAVELFQSLDLVPPKGAAAAALRLHPKLIDEVLEIEARMPELAANEHNRWVAERLSEGWIQTTAKEPTKADRDDRRKIHWLLMTNDQLLKDAPAEVKKDSNNVRAVFDEARRQRTDAAGGEAWKKRVRIGVMGPLAVDKALTFDQMIRDVREWMREREITSLTHQLEVVTPNAPGFDRLAAEALLRDWRRFARRPADLLRIEADELRFLDIRAEEKVDRATAERQTARLNAAPFGRNRRIVLTGGPIAKENFMTEVDAGAKAMSRLCDLMIYHAPKGKGATTQRHAKIRRDTGSAMIWVGEDPL